MSSRSCSRLVDHHEIAQSTVAVGVEDHFIALDTLTKRNIEAVAQWRRLVSVRDVRCIRSMDRTKSAIIQYADGGAHSAMLDTCRMLHQSYCDRHKVDYLASDTKSVSGGRAPHWRKVELLIETFQKGYRQVAWIDSDCVIVNHDFNLFDASGFGIAVCECFDSPFFERHLNTGVIICTYSEQLLDFLVEWNNSPVRGGWEDQSGFIPMMQDRPHRDLLTILPNRFNCLELHMEARDPFIRAFHGVPVGREEKVKELVDEVWLRLPAPLKTLGASKKEHRAWSSRAWSVFHSITVLFRGRGLSPASGLSLRKGSDI